MLQERISELIFQNLTTRTAFPGKSLIMSAFFFISFLFMSLLFGASAHSDPTPTTPPGIIAVAAPWGFLQNELHTFVQQEVQKSLKFTSPSRTIIVKGVGLLMGEIDVNLIGLNSDAKMGYNGIQFLGNSLQMLAQVRGLSIDQVIERTVEGHNLRFRIQGQCGPFKVRFSQGQAGTRFMWRPAEEGLQLTADYLQVDIPQEKIAIEELKCQGLEGLGAGVESEIVTLLADPRKIESLIKVPLLERLNNLISSKWSQYQLGQMYQIQKNGIVFYRTTNLEFDSDLSLAQYQIPDPASTASAASVLSPMVIMTEKNLNAFIEIRIYKSSHRKVDVSAIPEFSRLLKSKFQQFFVWPDLKNFSKSAKFELETVDTQNLTVNQSGGVYSVGGVAVSVLRGERGGVLRDYLNLTHRIQALVDPVIGDGKLTLKIHDVRSTGGWKFSEAYVKSFHPTERIGLPIQKKLINAITADRQVELALPVTELGGRSWKIKGIQHRPGSFVEMPLGQ